MTAATASQRNALLIGPPRSGTTLLRRIINTHPTIACPPEPFIVSSCCKFVRQHPVGYGVPAGPLTGLSFSGFDKQYLYGKLRQLVGDIYADICRREGKERWVDKDGHAFAYLNEVEAIFGDQVRYIFLIRHGLDAAVSIEELLTQIGAFPDVFHPYIVADPIILNAAARLWSDVARGIAQLLARRSDHALLVRYEDLVRDPCREVERTLSFLEVDGGGIDPTTCLRANDYGLGDPKNYARRSLSTDSVDRWTSLPRPVVARVAPILDPMLTEFGYERLTSTAAGAGAEDPDYRRVVRIGLALQRHGSTR